MFAGTGVTCKIKGAAQIFGDFISAVTEITLAPFQHVVLEATGGIWLILSGEPRKEQVYAIKSFTKAEAEAGVEPSATRPSFVMLNNTGAAGQLVVPGGGEIEIAHAQSLPLMPGQKWKANVAVTAATILQ